MTFQYSCWDPSDFSWFPGLSICCWCVICKFSLSFIDTWKKETRLDGWVSVYDCVYIMSSLCICCTWEKDKVVKRRTTLPTPTLLPYEIEGLAAMRRELGHAPVTSGTFSLSARSFQEWSKDFEGYLEVLWKTYVIKYFFPFQAKVFN